MLYIIYNKYNNSTIVISFKNQTKTKTKTIWSQPFGLWIRNNNHRLSVLLNWIHIDEDNLRIAYIHKTVLQIEP